MINREKKLQWKNIHTCSLKEKLQIIGQSLNTVIDQTLMTMIMLFQENSGGTFNGSTPCLQQVMKQINIQIRLISDQN